MDNESKQALMAEYELQSTGQLQERYQFYVEQAEFMHSRTATRGNRTEARAQFHLNLIQTELDKRDKAHREAHSSSTCDFGGPRRSGFATLGDLLAAKGKKLCG